MGEFRETAVDGAAHVGVVAAAPVHKGQDIGHAIAGRQMGLNGAGQRCACILV